MTQPLPDSLIRYLEQRDAQRAQVVNDALARLTDRERHLVKEAAVMGYVQAMRRTGGRDIPGDATIVVRVIEGCLENADLYPTIAAGPEAGA